MGAGKQQALNQKEELLLHGKNSDKEIKTLVDNYYDKYQIAKLYKKEDQEVKKNFKNMMQEKAEQAFTYKKLITGFKDGKFKKVVI